MLAKIKNSSYLCNVKTDVLAIRVTFPREGKALSILPILKELLRQLFYCMYLATKYLKNEAPFIVSSLSIEMLFLPL